MPLRSWNWKEYGETIRVPVIPMPPVEGLACPCNSCMEALLCHNETMGAREGLRLSPCQEKNECLRYQVYRVEYSRARRSLEKKFDALEKEVYALEERLKKEGQP